MLFFVLNRLIKPGDLDYWYDRVPYALLDLSCYLQCVCVFLIFNHIMAVSTVFFLHFPRRPPRYHCNDVCKMWIMRITSRRLFCAFSFKNRIANGIHTYDMAKHKRQVSFILLRTKRNEIIVVRCVPKFWYACLLFSKWHAKVVSFLRWLLFFSRAAQFEYNNKHVHFMRMR